MNKKHQLFIVIVVMLLLTTQFPVVTALASPSVTVQTSPSQAQAGETVAISGTAAPDELLSIKITDKDNNIVYYSAARADSSGVYQIGFTVPNLSTQTLTVVAGSGSNVATAHIEIYVKSTYTSTPTSETTPTLTPTPEPKDTHEPTNTPTPTPSNTSGPTGSPSPTVPPAPNPTESDDHNLPKTGDSSLGWIWWQLGAL